MWFGEVGDAVGGYAASDLGVGSVEVVPVEPIPDCDLPFGLGLIAPAQQVVMGDLTVLRGATQVRPSSTTHRAGRYGSTTPRTFCPAAWSAKPS
ncbi:hypothetical protein SAMN05216207_102041 [Pseudonocardia ammonioxydans]|uniref:Uncharacterized protein n=1 Tax=Pseudonocardia ammonioxydans TaxID=260086 RepID=A0A1I5BE32_PSUAM|nr:hypothetical protein SAMN05216207_102041 [Pseudonocardia ammonioxydans]